MIVQPGSLTRNGNPLVTGVTMKQEKNNRYSFVSAEQDMDFERIEREAPDGTLFILVEEKTRTNFRVRGWYLLVHKSVLENEKVGGTPLGFDSDIGLRQYVNPDWGSHGIHFHYNGQNRYQTLKRYRMLGGPGLFPKFVKQQIEKVRRRMNPKDTEVEVTYL